MNFLTDFEQLSVYDSCDNASTTRIGHLNLRVADLDRAKDFYCNVLGMIVSCYGPDIGLPTVFLAFGDYHHHIALNWFYGEVGNPKRARDCRLNHFALVYPDEGSLAKAVSRVLQHRISIDDARDHGRAISVYLSDPDGNGIELYYDRPRSYWFDSAGHLIFKSEPFSVDEWLENVLDYIPEVVVQRVSNQHLVVMQ